MSGHIPCRSSAIIVDISISSNSSADTRFSISRCRYWGRYITAATIIKEYIFNIGFQTAQTYTKTIYNTMSWHTQKSNQFLYKKRHVYLLCFPILRSSSLWVDKSSNAAQLRRRNISPLFNELIILPLLFQSTESPKIAYWLLFSIMNSVLLILFTNFVLNAILMKMTQKCTVY